MSASHDDHDDHDDFGPPRVDEVADGIFAYIQPDGSWWVNNAGFIGGRHVTLAIDTCATERRTRALLESIRSITGRDPTTLVNTHHHGDHTNGNGLLKGTTIIGHPRCRAAMLESGILRPDGLWEPVGWGELELAPPFVTFDDRLDVWVDDLRVDLHHLGPAAHTTNDVVVFVPDRKVLFTGDLVFNGGTPFVLMGSVSGSLDVLDRLSAFDAAVVVPGHGAPCTMDQLAPVADYLRFVQRIAAEGRAAGLTELQAARECDVGPFAELTDPERIVGNLHRAYAELDGAAPGAPIDVVAALVEMVAYNGGAPLRCLA